MDYTTINAGIWDSINECLIDKTTAISHEEYMAAQKGKLNVSLAGAKSVPREWFPDLKEKKILALACGGGQQCPVFAAHGGEVTVTDMSDSQLEKEKAVAEREGYNIQIIKADMAKPFPFQDESFDMIFNPVSNCYVEEILPVWKECARVIKKGGVLMMAFVKEEHFMFDPDFQNEDVLISRYSLPFSSLRDWSEEQKLAKQRAHMPLKFSHTLTEQIGGLIKAGFQITDIYEDCDGGGLYDKYMNAYVVVRAVATK